jgi:four helix bundle protein
MNNEHGMMNGSQKADLRLRTKAFALRIIHLYGSLPKMTEAQVLGKQLLRSGTSVGAQYREAVRARSRAEFVSKIEAALQELEETVYWIELLADGRIVPIKRLQKLLCEAQELIAIFVQSAKTAKGSQGAALC